MSDAGGTERASEVGGTTGGTSTGQPTPTTGGPVSSTGGGSSSTGAADDSSTGALASSSSGSTGALETTSTSTGEGSTGPPPRLFECFGCSCDAEISFCRKVFAGFGGGEDRLCPIVERDGLDSGCALYPRECVEAPSCECLLGMNGDCFCTEKGPGEFEVTCPLP